MAIYEFDPNQPPDSEFEPGDLAYLVAGNRGRLLDARRTPLLITAVSPRRGLFELEIGGFEDRGARWELGLDQIDRLQFARGGAVAPASAVAELHRARARFDRALVIECDPKARGRTLAAVAARRAEVRRSLVDHRFPAVIDLRSHIASRAGNEVLFTLTEALLADRGVLVDDRQFGETFVSNPASGELVKVYAIVLAELGLCPYRGKVVRDPSLLTRDQLQQRADHVVTRLALIEELWSRWRRESVPLYRAAAVQGSWPERTTASFVSATFSRQVAEDHFQGGRGTGTAVMWRQPVPIPRLFMTFLETPALNARFSEAEAILLGDPANRLF